MQGTCPTGTSGKTCRLGRRTVGPATARYTRRLARGAAIVLGENQLHRALEHRARRTGARREPLLELGRLDVQVTGKLVAPALQVLALLQYARAHLCPSRLLDHGRLRASAMP